MRLGFRTSNPLSSLIIILPRLIFESDMSDWIREAILDRLHGKHIHVNPLVAVDGLSESDAIKQPFTDGRSPYELVFHIVFWLEYSLDLMNGTIVVYKQGMSWETGESSWAELVDRFSKSMSRLEFIAENWDLDEEVRISDDLSTCVGAEILGSIQHTSYHLGQLVATRRAICLWSRK